MLKRITVIVKTIVKFLKRQNNNMANHSTFNTLCYESNEYIRIIRQNAIYWFTIHPQNMYFIAIYVEKYCNIVLQLLFLLSQERD